MRIQVGIYTIELHRAEETSHQEDVKRLANYVSLIADIAVRESLSDNSDVQK